MFLCRNKKNIIIMKICLNTFDPLKTHFYIVKLGFTGVYNIFLFLFKTLIVGTHLNCLTDSNEYAQSMF